MQKRSGKKVMGCSTDAAAKKARTTTPHQLEVLVLQQAHWRPPQWPTRELHGGNGDPLPVHEIRLRRGPPVHQEAWARGGQRARALRLPVRRSCGYSGLQLYAHVQDAHVRGSYSHFSPYILENILFTFFSIHHL